MLLALVTGAALVACSSDADTGRTYGAATATLGGSLALLGWKA